MSKNEAKETITVNEQIEKLRKELGRKEKQLLVSCNHKGKNGKLKIEPVYGSNGVFKCKKCGQEFSMNRLDNKKLLDAAELLNDAIQQVRCFSGESEKDMELCKQLGELAYNLGESVALYDKTVRATGKKKKKKKEHNNDNSQYGSYGWGGVSFGGKR